MDDRINIGSKVLIREVFRGKSVVSWVTVKGVFQDKIEGVRNHSVYIYEDNIPKLVCKYGEKAYILKLSDVVYSDRS